MLWVEELVLLLSFMRLQSSRLFRARRAMSSRHHVECSMTINFLKSCLVSQLILLK